MLYKKKNEKELTNELFQNPTAEYRGTPFWAWNDELNKEDLLWQIEQLKKMGFGGFHMHTRSGMATPYLSDEFMDLIRSCVDKAKSEDMLAYLYDEDRWPSGAAGGIVTKNKNFRQKFLFLTTARKDDVINSGAVSNYFKVNLGETPETVVDKSTGYMEGKEYLLAAYDIVLNENGTLKKYSRIGIDDKAEGTKWYAYIEVSGDNGWYNGQAYIDTLMPEAMAEFVHVTLDAYYNAVGGEFGKTIPSIFTDEPQFRGIERVGFSGSNQDRTVAWTTDIPVTFRKAYGYDIVDKIPEIFWDIEKGPSLPRYHFHDHISERFAEAFSDQYGKWCKDHGISMTGHYMEEPTLQSQSNMDGEVMRQYRGMGIPGIDMLCNAVELTTAKQTQSAKNQFGKEGMLSELYGVTGWDFDFRGHKFQGDWQAALGVTVRVPHLSWVSMKGSAKRDYPASISYQSSWYKEYPYVENHFARVNTALTRGKPNVKIGVIHPVESYWLHYGPQDSNSAACAQLEANFANVTNWLLDGLLDFDFICESLLPSLHKDGGNTFNVGEMSYSSVVVPGVLTLRSTTVDALEKFVAKGGHLVFLGKCPSYIDAVLSPENTRRLEALYNSSDARDFTSIALCEALERDRFIRMRLNNGTETRDYVYNSRNDGKYQWLFIARHKKWVENNDGMGANCGNLYIRGHKIVKLYNTLTGEIRDLTPRYEGDWTVVPFVLFLSDSLLLRLEDGETEIKEIAPGKQMIRSRAIDFKDKVSYTRHEPNVMVLDLAEWSTDGENYNPLEEILRIDQVLRRKYSFPDASGHDVQPWVIEKETISIFPHLKFTFDSEVEVPVKLAFEELTEVSLNGKEVKIEKDGYYTDKRIYTTKLGTLRKGENTIICKVPFGKRLSIENFFLLGEFDVKVSGCHSSITSPSSTINFGSIVNQGLPFYGAPITYKLKFTTGNCDLSIWVPKYKAAMMRVKLDGEDKGILAYAPYQVVVPDVKEGEHSVELTLYITRVNSFNGLHNSRFESWVGPSYWYSVEAGWSYEYQLKNNGILQSPVMLVFNEK